MALKLHHLNASRSQRIVWLLAELDTPHEIVHYTRNAETNLAPPDLLQIHPMGKSPLLEHDGVVIAETGAIAEYLVEKFDPEFKLHPTPESDDYPRYLEWIHSAEGAVFLPGLFGFYLLRGELTEHPLAAAMAAEQAKAMDHVERHLSKHAYFAGDDFSAADCLMGFQLNSAEAQGALKTRPASQAWLEKVRARPAYAAMLNTGI
ncbi:MAG: glutathione S-transferase family protein [Pseudomonadota bacterium]